VCAVKKQLVGKYNKIRQKILSGVSDKDISFSELCQLLKRLGFSERIKGDHHIFTKDSIAEIINLQPKGNKAKIYQVKQVRNLIIKYRLGERDVN
jgi:predicted RNA binding protein YcfA (HicA-like mRNA interferase family)